MLPLAVIFHPRQLLELHVAEVAAESLHVGVNRRVGCEQVLKREALVADAADELFVFVLRVQQRVVGAQMIFGFECGGAKAARERPLFVAFVILHVLLELLL